MKKFFSFQKIKSFLIIFVISIIVVELLLKLVGFRAIIAPEINIKVSPSSIFEADSTTGWNLKKGDFTIQLSDEAPISHVSINDFGDRITSKQNLIDSISKPVIQLYGCSNTFGFSLNDEQTQSYFLQNMLLNYEVQNKGVPAYSLGQMYLHLLKNVNEGRKPNIAVFNYGNFHDIRTAEHYGWSKILWRAMTNEGKSKHEKYAYPYYVLNDNDLKLNYIDFDELSESFLSKKLITYKMLNTFICNLLDGKQEEKLHQTSISIAELILDFCKENDIIPIFAFQSNSEDVEINTLIVETLDKKAQHTLVYSIDYGNETYNLCPYDCRHPNETAQLIFAEELYTYLSLNKIIVM